MPVQGHQLLAGEEPEPQKERHRGIAQVLGQPGRGLQIRFLDHVRRVDPPLEPPIHPQGDHAAKPISVPRQQRPQDLPIPLRGLLEYSVGLARIQGHS